MEVLELGRYCIDDYHDTLIVRASLDEDSKIEHCCAWMNRKDWLDSLKYCSSSLWLHVQELLDLRRTLSLICQSREVPVDSCTSRHFYTGTDSEGHPLVVERLGEDSVLVLRQIHLGVHSAEQEQLV